MKIHNVIEIFDNGEFVTIVTKTGSAIHLPMDSQHSITVLDMENPADNYIFSIQVDAYHG